jgi:hypothetical protein
MTLRFALLLAAVSVVQTQLTLEQHIANATGPGAVDCGTFSMIHNGVALPPRPSSTAKNKVDSMRESLACAEQALKDHKGFKIVQRGWFGFDNEVVTGVLGNADGVTIWFASEILLRTGGAESFITKPCSLKDVGIVPTPGGKNHVFKCGD